MRGTGASFASVFVSGFLAVYFLQAGLDKLLDRQANVMRFKVAFDQSPMRRRISGWLTLLTIGEMFAGILSAAGCLTLLLAKSREMAFGGAVLGGLSMLVFFFGLRLGRDYTTASQLVPYFVTCLAALVLLSP
ncbi:MAG: DoxX family membrane protein [Myxococcaceae bacterium]|nr:DoxX family membrane protein [Myxococcaceae bacterium]